MNNNEKLQNMEENHPYFRESNILTASNEKYGNTLDKGSKEKIK